MRTASRTFVERLIVFALLCSSFMVGCGDYSIKLPREYSLVRIYGGAFLIYHPDGKVAVDANVDGYKVYCAGFCINSEVSRPAIGFFRLEIRG